MLQQNTEFVEFFTLRILANCKATSHEFSFYDVNNYDKVDAVLNAKK